MDSPADVKAAAKKDIAAIQEQAEKDTKAVKQQETQAIKSGAKTKEQAQADAKAKTDKIQAAAEAAIKNRADQAKAVLKASYTAIEFKDTEGGKNNGKAAGAGDGSGGATTAGKLAEQEIDEAAQQALKVVAKVVAAAVGALLSVLFKQDPTPGSAGSSSNRKFDHRGNFRFRVDIGGVAAGAFKAVDGLSVQTEMIEYQGGGDQYARQIPGRPKIAPVTLKKGWVNSSALWQWMVDTMEGRFSFKQVSLILQDDDGQTDVVRYELTECWPSSWKGFQLDAMGNEAMVEEIEFQARHIKRVAG